MRWLRPVGVLVAVVVLARTAEPRAGWAGVERSAGRAAENAIPPLPRLADAGTRAGPDAPNVVLICIDTLRADHLSLYGYTRPTTPYIDEFSRTARVCTRAYATAPFTTPSVVSILSGVYPYRHRVRLLWQKIGNEVVTLPDWLKSAGYQTAAIVSNLVLSDEASGLASRFDHYDDAVDEPEPNRPNMLERRATRTTDAAAEWLRTQRDPSHPFFLWVHYIDPHGPYTPPADAPQHFTHAQAHPVDPEKVAAYARLPNTSDGNDYVDAYDAEVAYVDREVGRLLDVLEALDLADDALIVLTADHGEFLLERDDLMFCHGFSVDEAVLHVPLVVRHPSIPAGREDQPVSIADIAPTVLDAVGLELPAGLDGKSLAGAAVCSRPPYAEGPDPTGSGGLERAFMYSQFKLVLRHGRSNVPREAWTIDLTESPQDRTRQPANPDDAAYRTLARLVRTDPDPGGRPQAPTNDATSAIVNRDAGEAAIAKLRALGYVE